MSEKVLPLINSALPEGFLARIAKTLGFPTATIEAFLCGFILGTILAIIMRYLGKYIFWITLVGAGVLWLCYQHNYIMFNGDAVTNLIGAEITSAEDILNYLSRVVSVYKSELLGAAVSFLIVSKILSIPRIPSL